MFIEIQWMLFKCLKAIQVSYQELAEYLQPCGVFHDL